MWLFKIYFGKYVFHPCIKYHKVCKPPSSLLLGDNFVIDGSASIWVIFWPSEHRTVVNSLKVGPTWYNIISVHPFSQSKLISVTSTIFYVKFGALFKPWREYNHSMVKIYMKCVLGRPGKGPISTLIFGSLDTVKDSRGIVHLQ